MMAVHRGSESPAHLIIIIVAFTTLLAVLCWAARLSMLE